MGKTLESGNRFLKENSKKEGVIVTESGLQYTVLDEGEGGRPKETDLVSVHYTGMFLDGKKFDSSFDRGEPAVFPVNGVISGWVEGLQLMKTGSVYKFFIPSELAYGESGAGDVIGADEALVFEVELLDIL